MILVTGGTGQVATELAQRAAVQRAGRPDFDFDRPETIDAVFHSAAPTLVINAAAVVYLLVSKRLFGLRGGHAAYEAERHEMSLLEVEHAGTRRTMKPDADPVQMGG